MVFQQFILALNDLLQGADFFSLLLELGLGFKPDFLKRLDLLDELRTVALVLGVELVVLFELVVQQLLLVFEILLEELALVHQPLLLQLLQFVVVGQLANVIFHLARYGAVFEHLARNYDLFYTYGLLLGHFVDLFCVFQVRAGELSDFSFELGYVLVQIMHQLLHEIEISQAKLLQLFEVYFRRVSHLRRRVALC